MQDNAQRAQQKLEDFHKAAVALLANWDDVLNDGYPFQQSFDEWITTNLDAWLDRVQVIHHPKRETIYMSNHPQAYANKFFADQRDIHDLSDTALDRAFANCVIPAKRDKYPEIRRRIQNGILTIKYCRDWEGSLHDFLDIGDLVDSEFIDHFTGVLPPAHMSGDLVQMGEAYSVVNGRNTYPTLKRTENGWAYAGNYHLGQSDEPK